MSEPPDTLAQQIATLEAALQLPLPEEARRQLLANLQALQATSAITSDTIAGDKVGGDKVAGDKIVDPQGTVNVSGIAHIAVGVNLGRIIYGADPTEAQREQLTRYLRRLVAKLQRLPQRGLAARLDEGPGIALPKVYVMLATANRVMVAEGAPSALRHYFQDGDTRKPLKREFDPDFALPSAAIVQQGTVETGVSVSERAADPETLRQAKALLRAALATETVRQQKHLVLLGDPGGGKSTFLRHLAWALAQRGLDELSNDTALFAWEDTARLLPVLLPLRKLASRIITEGAEPATVSAVLRDEMTREYDARQADELLDQALESGAALLLFDGLDEVPLEAVKGVSADRLTTLRAVRAFAELHDRARVVLTCRVRAFDEPSRACLDWHVETLAPFTLGQIRHFIADWYTALIERGSIARDLGDAQQQALIAAIVGNERLRAMAGTPLLLTMMALILSERGDLPRDRPLLYERILEQLLGQWDKVRDAQSLAEYLDLPGLTSERLRPLLDQLSYDAHAGGSSEDGRGRLARGAVRDALIAFFEREHPRRAWDLAQRCLDYVEQRSGLLAPDGPDSYVFAHLTLQEHCAGRHILLSRDATALVMRRRADDRWREPILLGLGVVQQTNPWLIESVLRKLIDHEDDGHLKPIERWQRDLILAAEIGQDRDWAYLRDLRVDVGPLQRDLRRCLVELLADTSQPLPIAERVRAGFLLGDLGDPRFPVTLDDWRREIASACAGKTDSYFCAIPPYTGDLILWIARYQITNAQLQEWTHTAQIPPRRHETDANFNRPNQPAAGVNWYLASAFCDWLSQQTSVTIRLPSEAEWEATAHGHGGRAAIREDQDVRAWPYTVPVGRYPAGASAAGALDMVGNVWEWTSDVWRADAESEHSGNKGQKRVLRGGGYNSTRKQALTIARIGLEPGVSFDNGFRVALALED